MVSFRLLCEKVAEQQLPTAPNDNEAIKAIKLGLNLRTSRKRGETFWHDFIRVTSGDAAAIAALLGVDRHTVADWPHHVRKFLDQVVDQDTDADTKKHQRSHMILTGDVKVPETTPGVQVTRGENNV